MEYLPTLTPKVIQNNPNVGKYSIHGSLGISTEHTTRFWFGSVLFQARDCQSTSSFRVNQTKPAYPTNWGSNPLTRFHHQIGWNQFLWAHFFEAPLLPISKPGHVFISRRRSEQDMFQLRFFPGMLWLKPRHDEIMIDQKWWNIRPFTFIHLTRRWYPTVVQVDKVDFAVGKNKISMATWVYIYI